MGTMPRPQYIQGWIPDELLRGQEPLALSLGKELVILLKGCNTGNRDGFIHDSLIKKSRLGIEFWLQESDGCGSRRWSSESLVVGMAGDR